VEITFVKSYAIKDLAQVVLKPYSTRLVVLVAELHSILHNHVEPNLHLAPTNAPGNEPVATLKSSTSAILMTNLAQNVHSSSRNLVSATRELSKTNLAGSPKSAAAFPAGRN
jgi:hypothetical protein